jgi:hypothetical protein
MASVAIFIRSWCIFFLSPAHSEEILSKLAQFWNPSHPAGEIVWLARVVHRVPLAGSGTAVVAYRRPNSPQVMDHR